MPRTSTASWRRRKHTERPALAFNGYEATSPLGSQGKANLFPATPGLLFGMGQCSGHRTSIIRDVPSSAGWRKRDLMTESTNRIERVARLRVSDSVAAQLTQLITNGVYAVGEKLPAERVLADEFGVSRSSMREAIRGIEASGLVSSSHGVGVFVVSNTVAAQGQSDLLVFEDFTVPEAVRSSAHDRTRRGRLGGAKNHSRHHRCIGEHHGKMLRP